MLRFGKFGVGNNSNCEFYNNGGDTPPSGWVDDYSVYFDGIDQYARTPNFDNSIGEDFSISLWIKPITTTSNRRILSCRVDEADGYLEILTHSDGNLKIQFSGNGDVSQFPTSTDTFPRNTWTSLIITFSVGVLRVYANNVLDKVRGKDGNILSSEIYVGALYTGSNNANCNVDEISFWNTKLSTDDITKVYNSGSPANLLTLPSADYLTSWWQMGDGDTYPTLIDKIGGYDLTMINMSGDDIVQDTP